MTNPIVDVIFGGQYGSEAKRLFNEYYFDKTKPDAIVSNFGPNSGGFVSNGGKWATFAIGADTIHMLSPGSIIDLEHFEEEVKKLSSGSTVIVHENACVVLPEHKTQERKLVDIGSTMTGTAAAVVHKMMRDPKGQNIAKYFLQEYTVTNKQWFGIMVNCKRIQLSVPQGHSLSINYGMFPYCTSRNTSPQQALADAGIPVQWVDKIIACMRTFPIRVANRYNEAGVQIGWSGPCYDDQEEITWEDVGVPPEITSVSKNVRRVFTFSEKQYIESCQMNGVTDVFLNFMNYLSPTAAQRLFMRLVEVGPSISWCGYGPTTHDIATVKISGPNDIIDGREGCHPTMFELNKEEG